MEGAKAWLKGEVPYTGISSYAEAYKKARLFADNLALVRSGGETRQIKVLEVGCGYGEFAKNFLGAFADICKTENYNFFDNLVYHLSDFSQRTLNDLQRSSRFDEFATKVQFVRYDALSQEQTQALNNEIDEFGDYDLVLANYLLDQVPARIFAKSPALIKPEDRYLELYVKVGDYKSKMKKIKKEFKFLQVDLILDRKELEILQNCFRKQGSSTIVYSYGALQVLKNFMNLINKNGIIICSDFNASTKPGIYVYEPCYYGNSLAQAVNFEFLFKYFTKSQKVLLYEDPLKPLHTLILTRPEFEHPLELGSNYDFVYKQNLWLRIFYRFMVELRNAFWIFIFFIILYLSGWLIMHSNIGSKTIEQPFLEFFGFIFH